MCIRFNMNWNLGLSVTTTGQVKDRSRTVIIRLKNSEKECKMIIQKLLTDDVHWITSRQLSPSPATNLNHSPASLSLHNSCSNVSSFFDPPSSVCRLTRIPCAVRKELLRVFKMYCYQAIQQQFVFGITFFYCLKIAFMS